MSLQKTLTVKGISAEKVWEVYNENGYVREPEVFQAGDEILVVCPDPDYFYWADNFEMDLKAAGAVVEEQQGLLGSLFLE